MDFRTTDYALRFTPASSASDSLFIFPGFVVMELLQGYRNKVEQEKLNCSFYT